MWILIIPLFSILVVVWTWQFLNWVWLKPRKMEILFRKQGMKGSPYRFLFGDSKDISVMYDKAFSKPIGLDDDIVSRLVPNMVDTIQKYGNYSFSWSGPRPRIFIMDPAVARDVLSKHRLYLKTFKVSNPIVQLLVTGLASLEGEAWTKSRLMLKPAFNMDRLKLTVPAIQSCGEDTINEWKKLISKEGGSCSVVDVHPHLEMFTSAVLAQLMFSSAYTEDIKRTFHQLGELATLAKLQSKIFTIPGEKYLPTQSNRRANKINKYVQLSFTFMITERLERNARAPIGDDRDLLDILIEELYDGKITKKSERQKIIENAVGECKIFFFAGFETTSNLLTWAMILLSIHQEWQARAREEVFQVLGNKKDITSDDLAELKIVTMIINETLRLYPPIMELTRWVSDDTKINGYTIPKDSLVTFPTLMIHRIPEFWGEDALQFRPDRFAKGPLKAANGEAAFIPFGWGPRICIGMNFSMLESKTFLVMLLREFSFELSPAYTHAPIVAVTIQPQFGAPLVLRKL